MPIAHPSISSRTHTGHVRTRNEDTVRVRDEPPFLLIVADGMGGHPGGDVASACAAERAEEVLVERISAWPRKLPRAGELERTLAAAVEEAHRAVRRRGQEERRLQGMGTTLTVLLLLPVIPHDTEAQEVEDGSEAGEDASSGRWGVGHAGDSRAYLLRTGSFRRVTRDDTWVQEQVDSGALDPEDAWQHPSGHVLTQGIGLDRPPEPRIHEGRLHPGDRFLLCSDGLTDMLPEGRIRSLLSEVTLDAAADRLVEEALEAGGRDNVTVALAELTTT